MIQDSDIQPVKLGRPKRTDKQKARMQKLQEKRESKVTLRQAQDIVNAISNPTDDQVEKMASPKMTELRQNIATLTKEQDIVQAFIKKSISVVSKSGTIVDLKLSRMMTIIEENPDYLDEMSIKDIKDIADIGASQAKAIAILTGQTPDQAIGNQVNNTVVFVDAWERANALLSAFLKGNR